MRNCSNPLCRAPITACFGTVKAGDFDEAMQSKRRVQHVRDLCPKCATIAIRRCEAGEDKSAVFAEFGWA